MRICLILPGRLDTFEEMYPSLKEFIIDPLNPDIFFSGYPNEKGLTYCEEKMKELWNPKKYLIRDYTDTIRKEVHPNDLKFEHKTPETTPNTWLSGIYNVYLANSLKREYEIEHQFRYDVCIKGRTDLLWYDTPTQEELDTAKEDNKVLIPTAWDFRFITGGGVSDAICLSNSESMDKYCCLTKYIDEYYDKGHIFHPESLVGHHISHMNLERIKVEKGHDPFTKQKNESGWAVIDPNPKRIRI